MHVGGLPVGDPGHDGPLHVAEDRVEVLALLRGVVRQHLPQVARLHVGKHATFSYILQIVRYVVHHLLT